LQLLETPMKCMSPEYREFIVVKSVMEGNKEMYSYSLLMT